MHVGLIHRLSSTAEDVLRLYAAPEDQALTRPDSMLARAVARAILTISTGSGPWTIEQTALGAPRARSATHSSAPSISLSHSGGWIACAASVTGAVGIDIERRKPGRDISGIASYAFGRQEQAAAVSGEDRFYAIWVLREAIAKATGEGLPRVTDGVDRVGAGPFRSAGWSRMEDADWWLMHQRKDDVDLAVALRLGIPPRPHIKLRWWPDPM